MSTAPPLRLLVVDDHRLFRESLSSLLDRAGGFTVVGQAANAGELFGLLDRLTPDLILLDIDMPGASGLECAAKLADSHPALPLLMLTMYDDPQFAQATSHLANVRGYLVKNVAPTTLIHIIRMVVPVPAPPLRHEAQLTRQEVAVLRLILAQKSNEEISERLSNSVRTIEGHRRNIYQKTGARNLVGIVQYALRRQLITLEELDELARLSLESRPED